MGRLPRMAWSSALLAVEVVLPFGAAGIAGDPPLAGCYERAYDAAHLTAHKGQLVDHATLSIGAPAPDTQADKDHPVLANGELKLRVRGSRQSFDSLGACRAEGGGLLCSGSLSAAEADTCRSRQDGVRQCRIDTDDAGSFQVEARSEGVLVTVRERLELVPAPYDAGPFLYLSPTNAENHAFLLEKASCK